MSEAVPRQCGVLLVPRDMKAKRKARVIIAALRDLFHPVKLKYRGAFGIKHSSIRHKFERSSILVGVYCGAFVSPNGMMRIGRNCY